MSEAFRTVRGNRYHFIEDSELRDRIDEAGRRNIIFVEGYDDEIIYNILYSERLSEAVFVDVSSANYSEGGCKKVKKLIKDVIEQLNDDNRFYAIIDRDFLTDEERLEEMEKEEFQGNLYIFSERYTLENYFIEPGVLSTFLTEMSIGNKNWQTLAGEGKMTEIIGDTLSSLTTISAANILLKNNRKKYLDISKPCDKNIVLGNLLSALSDSQSMTTEQITEEYNSLLRNLEAEDTKLQKYINGKYFFHHFNKKVKEELEASIGKQGSNVFSKISKPYLARILKDVGLQDDFRELEQVCSLS